MQSTRPESSHPGTRKTSLLVNGEPVTVGAATIAALIAELGYGERKVATARNGSFVPERARAETPLEPGDAIEIVSARQGG